MNKQQLASKIWESANQMRSKIEANEYKDYILGFIFYKFLSEKEVNFCKSKGMNDEQLKTFTEENTKVVQFCQKNLGYFISYENLFSTWILKGKDFDVGNVRNALNAFDRLISDTHKKVYKDIFFTLQNGLHKLGDNTGSQTKAINGLISLIKDIPMDNRQDYDVLGFIYEYLISMFAANAGKKAGEFYTPHEVSLLMSEIVAYHLKDKEKIEIYDPTSGSGSLLIDIGKTVQKHMNNKDNIKYYAQEIKENTYNLTRMNLVMRGIEPSNIVTRNGDTLEDDWPYFEDGNQSSTYERLYVDAVVSNPPYSQQWDPENKDVDPRYADYGLAPKSKADYAFLLHDLYHLKPEGIMTIVLPHGVLFRGKAGKDGEKGEAEYEIRKNLIENNKIDAIIGLPANIFFGTGIPTIIMVLKQNRDNNDVLIIDASKHFTKEGKQNKLQASDIKRIVDVIISRKDVSKFSRAVSKEEIRKNDYNLNIPRYVDSSEDAENYDIYASVIDGIPKVEVEKFESEWLAFPSLKNELFTKTNDSYYELKSSDIKNSILSNTDVIKFEENYIKTFSDFDSYLKTELITNINDVNPNKEEDILAEQIFEKLTSVPLVDKYTAYQSLDDEYQTIANDLEIIKSEGFETCKKVEPNMVIKNKEEVQDGWKGRVFPFELVQITFLKDDVEKIDSKANELEKIESDLEELVPKTEEEEAEEIELTDEQKKKQKELQDKAKTLRKDIVKLNKELEENTIKKIESISDDEVKTLLELKWITPLVNALNEMPKTVIADFISAITKMTENYSETLTSLDKQIKETQSELFNLMSELGGNEFDLKGLETLKNLLGGM